MGGGEPRLCDCGCDPFALLYRNISCALVWNICRQQREREKKTLIIWVEINNIARGEQFRESFRKIHLHFHAITFEMLALRCDGYIQQEQERAIHKSCGL
jgi:hypothetical protein